MARLPTEAIITSLFASPIKPLSPDGTRIESYALINDFLHFPN